MKISVSRARRLLHSTCQRIDTPNVEYLTSPPSVVTGENNDTRRSPGSLAGSIPFCRVRCCERTGGIHDTNGECPGGPRHVVSGGRGAGAGGARAGDRLSRRLELV